MAVMWRCPECETMNTEDKCIICGCSKPKTINNTNRPNIVQEQLKISNSNQESLKSVQNSNQYRNKNQYKIDNHQDEANSIITYTPVRKKKRKKARIIIISCICVIIVECIYLGFINRNEDIVDKPSDGLPDITMVAASLTQMTTVETTAPVSEEETTTTVVPESVTESVVEDDMVVMPLLMKKDYSTAIKMLDTIGLQYKVTYSEKKYVDINENCVYSQKPATGSMIKRDTVVEIGISTYKSEKQQPITETSISSDTLEPTKEWNETEISETLYIKTSCYSRTEAVVWAETVMKYEVGTKIDVVAATDTGYYKLKDGTFIHSDYVTDTVPTVSKIKSKNTSEPIIIDGKEYSINTTSISIGSAYFYDGDTEWHYDLSDDDINAVSKLINLEELYIVCPSSNIDLSFLNELKKLKVLKFSGYTPVDLSELSNLKNLIVLDLSLDYSLRDIPVENRLTNIEPLASLTNLEELDLSEQPISEISALSKMKKLRKLNLDKGYIDNSKYKISDISALSELINLEDLDLSDNFITDLSPLQNCNKITCLNLWNNKITDISALSNMKNLSYLTLGDYRNEISDLSPLYKLKKLGHIRMGYWAKSDDEAIQILKKELPNCVVMY